MLVSAFLRPLKDPFPPARCAAIGAIASTHSYCTTSDIASRLLPALCGLTVDKEKTVRDEVEMEMERELFSFLSFSLYSLYNINSPQGVQGHQSSAGQVGEIFRGPRSSC